MPVHRSIILLRGLLIAASVIIFLLTILGGIVRVTESGGACPDWPTCLGQWTLPQGEGAGLNYSHRLMSGLALVVLVAAAWVARKLDGISAKVHLGLAAAMGLILVQVILGALVSFHAVNGEKTGISAIHLALTLLIQAALFLSVSASYWARDLDRPAYRDRRSSFDQLSMLTLVFVFLLMVSGTLVASLDGNGLCRGWPLCDGSLLPGGAIEWAHLIHRGLVLLSSILMVMLTYQAWKTQRQNTAKIVAATATIVLFFAQALLGSKLQPGAPVYMLGLHQATAAAVWCALALLFAVNLTQPASSSPEETQDAVPIERKAILKDFLMLTKPIVVLLLLVTTYAGMVIGARAWPSLQVTFWTLLAGFMAAGGSGAINQYIDRIDDSKMQRTQKRPIPAGRLSPGEGLAFGVALALGSFYIMVAFTNFLAAMLTLAGIIYYVVLYSMLLKKTTVQNIVIGGGAGAIPPLVGWAAATGSLNIPSLFLFAVVFMWTPPHFWALALVRSKDYARAGVPMLPVVRGELETRKQILIYTLELVALTVLLPLFGLGGSIYLVGAVALGGWLILAAWKLWTLGGNKVAWKMYRYSSMYLAFLFVILMVDALL